LMMAVRESDEITDSNVVKVVTDQKGRALYFSRSAIPFHRDEWKNGFPENISKVKEEGMTRVFKHVGLYAYTRSFLLEFTQCIRPDQEYAVGFELQIDQPLANQPAKWSRQQV